MASPRPASAPSPATRPDGPDDGDGPRRLPIASTRAAATTVAVLAVMYTLYFAQDVLVPIGAAILLYLILSPVSRLLSRAHLPKWLGSLVIVVALVGMFLGGFYALAGAAATWLERMPGIIYEIEYKLDAVKEPLKKVREASKDIQDATNMEGGEEGTGQREVVVQEPTMLQRLLSSLRDIGIQLAVTVFLLYLLIAYAEVFREKVVKIAPNFRDKRRAVMVWHDVERYVSTYLLTVTLINLGLGLAIALALLALDMPNPFLWGAMAAALNFVPYLGALIGVSVVALVGLVTFVPLDDALLPALAYLALNTLEGQVITPIVLGRRLTLNPVVIFVTIILWGWLWGIPGALMAVPLLVVAQVLCRHVEAWQPIAELMSGRAPPGAAAETATAGGAPARGSEVSGAEIRRTGDA